MWELRACQMYGCRPSELAEEDYHRVIRHKAILSAERGYIERDEQSRADAARRKANR